MFLFTRGGGGGGGGGGGEGIISKHNDQIEVIGSAQYILTLATHFASLSALSHR